jgi:hypothetical protein
VVWHRGRTPGAELAARSSLTTLPFTTDNEGLIDDHAFRRSGNLASRDLSGCHSLSYTTWTALRQDVDKLHVDDSKFQINDFTLQIGDFTLQIGDSTLQIGDFTLRIGDFTLPRASSNRRIDVTKRWIVDLTDLPPFLSLKSTIRNLKSTIRSFKSVI